MKPGTFFACAVIDRLYRGAEAHRRRDEPAVHHARQHHVDAVFRRAVGLRGNIELRNRNADHGVLIRRLELDRLEFVGRKGLGGLAALDDFRKRHRLLRLRMRDRGLPDHQFAGRHAHRGGRGFRQCDAPRGTRAAHRVEVHHRAPAAAGNLGAEHGIVELRIVGRELNPHVLPARAEFFGDDLRHGRGNVLAHVGLAAGDRDDVRPARSSTRRWDRNWPVRRMPCRRRACRARRNSRARGRRRRMPTRNERRLRSAGSPVGDFHVGIHVALRSVAVDAVRISEAARMIAFWMRE